MIVRNESRLSTDVVLKQQALRLCEGRGVIGLDAFIDQTGQRAVTPFQRRDYFFVLSDFDCFFDLL